MYCLSWCHVMIPVGVVIVETKTFQILRWDVSWPLDELWGKVEGADSWEAWALKGIKFQAPRSGFWWDFGAQFSRPWRIQECICMLCWIYSFILSDCLQFFGWQVLFGKCPSQSTDGSKTHRWCPEFVQMNLTLRCFSKMGDSSNKKLLENNQGALPRVKRH